VIAGDMKSILKRYVQKLIMGDMIKPKMPVRSIRIKINIANG
jgi:hypothetical protein